MAISDSECMAVRDIGSGAPGLARASTGAPAPGRAGAAPDAGDPARGTHGRPQGRKPPEINLIVMDRSRLTVTRKRRDPASRAEQGSKAPDHAPERLAQPPRPRKPAGASRRPQGGQDDLVFITVPTDQLHTCRSRCRKPYDESAVEALAASIRAAGWCHPILVRPHPAIARHYEIVVGDLPFQAARSAGLACLPVAVCRLSDLRAFECVLLEDVRRPDLTPLEVASGYGQLIKTFNYGLGELAKLVGKSERQVAHLLLLLEAPAASQDASFNGLPASGKLPLSAEMAALERRLSILLGLKVEIASHGRRGSVKMTFEDFEQFERVARHLSSFDTRAPLGPATPGPAA
jgi:ParB/RepB/Spo0J family partition protein